MPTMSYEEKSNILEDLKASRRSTMQGDEASVDMGRQAEEGLDMFNRDPRDMNAHVKTQFADVIGEPDGAYSGDCVWQNSFRCFNWGKGCCYKGLTLLCAIPLAFMWGCQFACITFMHIWMVSPCFRVFDINCECFKRFWETCVSCFCDPCNASAALIFSKINLRTTRE